MKQVTSTCFAPDALISNARSYAVSRPRAHLRVIGRLLAIKHIDFFIGAQRHAVAIVDISRHGLNPHVPVAILLAIACAQVDGEGIAAKEQLGRVHLAHALELRPNLSPVKHLVPALRGRGVRRVGQHHIDATVRQGLQEVKAVALIEFGTHERS